MGFAGELATIGLPEVFRNVAFSHLTGVLRVRGDGHDAAIRFDNGAISAFSGGESMLFDYETLAECAGAAPPDVIQQARSRPRRRTLREALSESDAYLHEAFCDAVSDAVTEEILHLFQSAQASFVFDEGTAETGLFDAEQLDLNLRLDTESLAVEAAKRSDEWHAISARIGSEDAYFVADPAAMASDPQAAALLERLDGTRDLRSAIQGLPHSRLELLRTAAQLIEAGAVQRASADHMRTLAEQAEEVSEINHAAGLLRAAIRQAGDDLDLHRELVALYERAGRFNDAAASYKRLGEVQERIGDVTGAAESYGEAVRLRPHDTDALQRVVTIHDGRGDIRAFLESGRMLADAHVAQGRHEAALTVLQELLVRDPTNISLRESIAAAYIKMHEPQNAAQELLSLAESASAANGYHRALHYYRSVLAVDRSCIVAAERITELQAGRDKIRKRAQRRRRLCALVAIVVGLGLWQGAREVLAQEALQHVAQAAVGDDPIGAVARYAVVCKSFPWTWGAAHAEEMVRVLLLEALQRIRAEKDLAAVHRLGEIEFPDGVRELWHEARDGIRARASEWAER